MSQTTSDELHANQGWNRRPWALRVAVALVLLGALLNLNFLFNNSPLDLSEDECHYWEWSRHLDYGYYSKPPGIAWAIRGGVELARLAGVPATDGVALMPWIRLPGVVFGVVSGIALLSLARRVFRDDRAALAVVALSAAAPMFVIGGMMVTIDSPMYMCWVLTLWALWRFIEPRDAAAGDLDPRTPAIEPSPAWLYAAAVFCSMGMLFKPVLIALPLSAMLAAWADPRIRRRLRTFHSLAAMLIVLASQIPVAVWNARHDWVTFRHMGRQAGVGAEDAAGGFLSRLAAPVVRELSYIGGQIGVLGGALAVFLLIAVIIAFRGRRSGEPQDRTRFSFLLAMGLPLWIFYALLSLWTSTEPNWPAASYAAGMVLLAGIVVRKWSDPDTRTRRAWRIGIAGTVAMGVVFASLALNAHRFYTLFADAGTPLNARNHPRKWDLSATKLRGYANRGRELGKVLADFRRESDALRDSAITPVHVVANRYDTASSLSFYLPDQPFVYCIMSRVGGRMNQYDLWPGLSADSDAGSNVLLVGAFDPKTIDTVIRPAFDRIDTDAAGKPRFQRIPVEYHGVIIRELSVLRCYGFKGWPAPVGTRRF